ncbi:hypothetical protein [Streptococcus sp. 19428wC2_LYSM12]|nr:hypothetical protein [Streptococcus sp. 19428wC2_LYSM12]
MLNPFPARRNCAKKIDFQLAGFSWLTLFTEILSALLAFPSETIGKNVVT